jgi:hypothetical protein
MATNLAVGGMSYLVAFPRGQRLVDRGYHGCLGLIVVPGDSVVRLSLPGDTYSQYLVCIDPKVVNIYLRENLAQKLKVSTST